MKFTNYVQISSYLTSFGAICLTTWLVSEGKISLLEAGILLFLLVAYLVIFIAYVRIPAQDFARKNDQNLLDRNLFSKMQQQFFALTADLETTRNTATVSKKLLEYVHDLLRIYSHTPNISLVLTYGTKHRLHPIAAIAPATKNNSSHISEEKGIIQKTRQAGEYQIQHYTNGEMRDPAIRYYPISTRIISLLCFPIITGGVNYGFVLFAFDKHFNPTDNVVYTLSSLVHLTAIAFQFSEVVNGQIMALEKAENLETSAREEVARDLHDFPTRTLNNALMKVNKILETEISESRVGQLNELHDLIQTSIEQVNFIPNAPAFLTLETGGLEYALLRYVQMMNSIHEHKINIKVDVMPNIDNLLPEKKHIRALYRFILEGITNSIRYSEAESLIIKIDMEGDRTIDVLIEDNGIGYDLEDVQKSTLATGTSGLVNMQDYALILGHIGHLNIKTAKGSGTVIRLSIPIADSIRATYS